MQDASLNSPSLPVNSAPSREVAPSVHATWAMDRAKLDIFPPVMKLSPEIVCHVARFLPYRDAWIAASVCGAWRAPLLADPYLWSYISIHLTEDTFRAWLPTLQTLIKRNAQRPLTLELQCDVFMEFGEEFNALEVVAAFLAGHMEVITSLSIAIPSCNTTYWHRLLRKRAPLLEVLRIHNNTFMDDTPKLPSQLFGGYAPRLRSVVLEQAYFPDDLTGASGRALAGVTSLSFHTSGSIQHGDVLERLARVMPGLQQLTCTALDEYMVAPYCPLALHLRVNVADGVSAVVAGFPRAKSVVYSFAGIGGHRMLYIVEAAICAESQQQPITAVDIAWTPLQANVFWLQNPSKSERYLSVSLNGRPVVVDVTLEMLRKALTTRAIEHFAGSLKTLSVVEETWDLFAAADMPALRDLAFSVPAREDWTTVGSPFDSKPPARQYKLQALRLIRPSEQAAGGAGTGVPVGAIVNLLRSVVAAGSSPTLHLYGISIVGEGSEAFGDLAARTVHDAYPGEQVVESWSWELARDKMVVPRAA